MSQWFSGSTKNIESKHLAKIASKYGASLEWLVTGEQPPPNLPPGTRWHPVIAWETPDDLPPDEYVIIPRVNVKFSAGSGQIAYEVEVWLFFKHSASFL